MMKQMVLASNNSHKLQELQVILAQKRWQLLPQNHWQLESIEETGLSFVENALLKARHACKNTNLPAIADDSGLCVPALNGAPGLYSARYAGVNATTQNNNLKLLQALKDRPESQRQAYYVCVIVFLSHQHDVVPIICQGKWHGQIAMQAAGDNGFGYDPIVYLPEYDCTVAQLESEKKNKISHRAQALEQLKQLL